MQESEGGYRPAEGFLALPNLLFLALTVVAWPPRRVTENGMRDFFADCYFIQFEAYYIHMFHYYIQRGINT